MLEQANAFAWLSAATIFLGALLLFQVQPLISKMILPWFGGSSAVWTTCMLFFQVGLLAGYAYAHGLTRLRRPAVQVAVHSLVLLAALATLPLTRVASFQPTDNADPTASILWLLALGIGLPYFALSATGPLVQTWFARVYHQRSPYRLYALSNFGSLLALLSYPIVMEPWYGIVAQAWIWSAAFLLYAVLMIYLAATFWKQGETLSEREQSPAKTCAEQPNDGPAEPRQEVRWRSDLATAACWLLLPAFASMMLLAVTNQLCQNIAVVPLLWVAPLSLYLVSFVICFDKDRWYWPRWYALGAIAVILLLSDFLFVKRLAPPTDPQETGVGLTAWLADNLTVQILVHLAMLFFVCMICHGEVARRRPAAKQLTAFYLCVAAGGAMGGLLVAVVCPLVFRSYFEFSLGVVMSFVLAAVVLVRDAWNGWFANRIVWKVLAGVGSVVGLAAVLFAQYLAQDRYWLLMQRNFYGVVRVEENYARVDESGQVDSNHGLSLYSGNTTHGYQFLRPERRMEPTSYYVESSGVGLALREFPRQQNMRVGVIGLGVGTVAAYGSPGDYYRFYEINPAVVDLATSGKHFTFLEDSPADTEVILGDGRLSLQREQPLHFDVLIVDAFTGDTVPTHLLTAEAFDLYLRHLQADGVLAVHVSNRYFNLVPILARLAEYARLPAVQVLKDKAEGDLFDAPSKWVLITNNRDFLQSIQSLPSVTQVSTRHGTVPLWTDRYSNVLQLLW